MKAIRGIILVTLIFAIFLGVSIGIYIFQINNLKDKSNLKGIALNTENVETSVKSDYNGPKINSIGVSTKLIKKEVYTKGEPFIKTIEQKVSDDILGMDKIAFEEYLKTKGYLLEEFAHEKVVFTEKIDKWPVGLYVLKSLEDSINIFKVNDNGELTLVNKSALSLDHLTPNERDEFIKGKVYASLEEAEQIIAEFDS